MFRLFVIIFIFTASSVLVKSVIVTKSNETIVAEKILENLGPSTLNRPVLDPSTIINVNLSFVVTHIIELNDLRQELKVAGWFRMNWQNEFIRWNASEYGVDCVIIPGNSIWKPDITLDNNIDEEFNQFHPETNIKVCSDGSTKYSAYSIFRSSCYISIESFPHDNQTCHLRFSSWVHDMYELDIRPELRSLDQDDNFDENGVWELIAVEARREVEEYKSGTNPYVYTIFYIHLMRRHEFYLLFIFIPYCFCSFLVFWMFFIPTESGEKLSYGITAVLGMIVFQQIIAFSLPPIGHESTTIGKFFTSVVGFGIMCVFVEIIVNNIYMQGSVYKICRYGLNWYWYKTRDMSEIDGDDQADEMSDLRGDRASASGTPMAASNVNNGRKVQYYCDIFDFCFGVFCLIVLFILIIVISINL